MGLDIYVGTLSRYYEGSWETIIQQAGREAGIPVAQLRPAGPLGLFTQLRALLRSSAGGGERAPEHGSVSEAEREAAEARRRAAARARIEAWRADLNERFAGQLPQPLDWDESDEAPYFTDKPAWDGYGSLLLLAASDEHPELPRPTGIVDDWAEHPAWQEAERGGLDTSRYAHLLAPELWLPCEFPSPLDGEDPRGQDMWIGSSVVLLRLLRDLNARTFQADADTLSQWLYDGVEADGSFEVAARFGLAMMLHLAEQSVTHRLPMKQDY
jgi:hypothetical protein